MLENLVTSLELLIDMITLLKPFGRTVMNSLKDNGYDVIAIGKINDIYDGEGVTEAIRTKNNMDGMDQLIEVVKKILKVSVSLI